MIVRREITAVWLVGEDTTPTSAIGAWCRATATETSGLTVLEQVAPGRGVLAPGRGALVLSGELAALGGGSGWWTSRIEARFALRSVVPASSPPRVPGAPYMLMTRVYVAEERRQGFREWLDAEHSQRQLVVPGSRWYLGYEELGERHSFMNLWGLLLPDIVESDLWRRTSDTPWRGRMLSAIEGTDRAVYRFAIP